MGPKLGCVALLSRLLSHPGKDLWVLTWEGGDGREIRAQALTHRAAVTAYAVLNHRTPSARNICS